MVTYDIRVKTLIVIVTYNDHELALKCLVVSSVLQLHYDVTYVIYNMDQMENNFRFQSIIRSLYYQ